MGNDTRLEYCLIATFVLIIIAAGVHSLITP
jgi:Flp pilus assembly pilin Flp